MNHTKRALILSVFSVILCFAMLLGTTYAWFTDTATSNGNKILAGELKIDLLMDINGEYTSIKDSTATIFGADGDNLYAKNDSADTVWEPGKTQIVYLAVKNLGNLALKYNILLTVTDNGLVGALEYAIIDGAKASDLSSATEWSDITAISGVQTGDIAEGTFTAAPNGVMDEIKNGTEGETQYFALAVHMKETAGNDYQGKYVTIDVLVTAGQATAEEDAFDDQYDKDAEYGKVSSGDATTNYLTFTANTAGSTVTPKFKSGSYQYSTDGTNWTDGAIDGTTTITLTNVGDKVMLKGENCVTGISSSYCFSMTGSISASGSVTSLTDGCGIDKDVVLTDNCYAYLFRYCTALTTAPELPATTLTKNCYYCMFQGCTNLTVAPALPATVLTSGCYNCMFNDCENLTTAPELPAGKNGVGSLAGGCYASMFSECTKLTEAPALPATTLAENCYDNMFRDCTALVTAPELNATTIASNCYSYMFAGCTALVNAPALPATNLTDCTYCYVSMFEGCTALVTAPALPAENISEGCYSYMFTGCTALVTAPALPATTLYEYCYQNMFAGCTALTTAPTLSATTIEDESYKGMFNGCSSLRITTVMPTTGTEGTDFGVIFSGEKSYSSSAIRDMFYNCVRAYGVSETPEFANGTTYYWTKGKFDQTAPTAPQGTVDGPVVTLTPVSAGKGTTYYGCSKTDDASTVSNWQTGLVFDLLDDDTDYYFFAKYEGDENYKEAVSDGTLITTGC